MKPDWCIKVCGEGCRINDKEQPFIDKKLDICTKYGPVMPKEPRNAFGTVWLDENVHRLYYCDFRNAYISISSNGHKFIPSVSVMLGEPDGWDRGIDCATVFQEGPMWYMLYRGHNGEKFIPYAIGLAGSFDGYSWFKCADNPVMVPEAGAWDGQYIGSDLHAPFDPWGIIKVEDTYYMWFNSEHPSTCRTTGLATSKDLVNWKRDAKNPIFENGKFCMSPFKYKDNFYLIVTAGGFKRDGTNRFELYRDKKPTFYPEDREYLGVILNCGTKGEFDDLYIDGPNVLTSDIQRNPIIEDGKIKLYYTGEGQKFGQWCHGLAYLDIEKL